MILSGSEIRRQVDLARLSIDPFDPKNLNPNSYNYHLGNQYVVVPPESSADIRNWPVEKENANQIPEKGMLLIPGKVYLAQTRESIGSCNFVTNLSGRSSIGRLGLFVQVSAKLGNLGPPQRWTLELTCVQKIRIYPHMRIGQVSFWCPSGRIVEYDGQYLDDMVPKAAVPSLLFHEIKNDPDGRGDH